MPDTPTFWATIGEGTHPEFAAALALLENDHVVHYWSSISDAVAASDGSKVPEVLIVWQLHPDEYCPQDADDLIAAFPTTRLVVVQGPWCASERRTRSTWPLAVLCPVPAARTRFAREAEVVAGTRDPLPLTATRDEIAGWIEDDLAERFVGWGAGQ